MKKYIRASEMRDFEVEVTFCGMVGSESYYDESGKDEDEAINAALEDAKDDLEATNVEEVDDGEFVVTVQFNGLVGVESDYTVTADDEDEAESAALDEAADDLEAKISEEYADEEDEEE